MKTLILLSMMLCFLSLAYGQISTNKNYNLLIGTYTSPGKSNGIYVYTFNVETGDFSHKSEVGGIKNPSFLAISNDRKHVYSVSEIGDRKGTISAFVFDAPSGKLTFLNGVTSGGDGPCYVSVDKKNKYVFAGNYSGGSLSAIPINADGTLSEDIQSIKHFGSSINRDQDKAHVHATVLSPDDRYLFVPDLGTDKVNIYKVDINQSKPLTPAEPAFAKVETGSGPRHFTFHPNGKFAYVIQEITGLVTGYDYKDGKLTEKQTVTMPSAGFTGTIDAADIHISPDGKFLYGSLRGDINEIVIYAIDSNGKLVCAGRNSTMGTGPRNFAIDPAGNFLLVGNQRSDEIVIFKRNQKTGLLTPTGKNISIGAPVCLKFVAAD
ncbi:MAG: lactonase family protein [Bacteroidia bacterium]|nr:lactonase family protein [Bacteroidia bacterium]